MKYNSKLNLSRSSRMPSNLQGGFTIVELMIAGLLGIILTAGVIQLFVGSNRNYTLQNELANVQEDGRFALIFLKNEIQRGGWDNFGMEAPRAINLNSSSDGANDSVAVAYALPPNSPDCNGAIVADGNIVNQFLVGGASGEELMCLGNGGGVAQPLISGVKSFQVLYGVETSNLCPDGAVNQYMTWDQLNAAGTEQTIVSIRVALLLASDDDVLVNAETKTHDLLDTELTTNDKLAYRVFQQTIFMPNAIHTIVGNPQTQLECQASKVGS